MTYEERTKLRETVDSYIQDRIASKASKIKSLEETNRTKGLSFFESLDLKRYKADAHKLQEASMAFFNFKYMNSSSKSSRLPLDLRKSLEAVGAQLSQEDRTTLSSSINSAMRESVQDQKEAIQEKIKNVQSTFKKADIADRTVFFNRTSTTMTNAIEVLGSEYLLSIQPESVSLDFSSQPKSVLPSREEILFEDARRLLRSGFIEENQTVQTIMKSASTIQEAMISKSKASKLNSDLTVLLSKLVDSPLEFKDTERFLRRIYAENIKTIEKCDSYLQKYDLERFRAVLAEARQKEAKTNQHKQILQQASLMAYEIERAIAEGKSDDEVAKLEENLRKLSIEATMANVHREDFEVAVSSGKEKYRTEKKERDIFIQARREEQELDRQYKSEMAQRLRNLAIEQLEREGAFEGSYEWRNGDAYSTMDNEERERLIARRIEQLMNQSEKVREEESARLSLEQSDRIIADAEQDLRTSAERSLEEDPSYRTMATADKEAEIQKKMGEIREYVTMTPEQRGLQMLKSMGRIPQEATVSDLSYQQVNDFRIGYKDTEEDRKLKEGQKVSQEQRKKKATTIYAQYLRYLASIEDKTTALKFSEFSRVVYAQDDVDLSMVDEEVKGRHV